MKMHRIYINETVTCPGKTNQPKKGPVLRWTGPDGSERVHVDPQKEEKTHPMRSSTEVDLSLIHI